MATVFRGPLFSQQQRRPEPSGWSSGPNLLTSTLLAVAVPFCNASAFTSPQHHPSLNADTSHGIPKTLTADAVRPFFNPPHFAPQQHGRNEFLNADTSHGVPKTLYADSVRPFFVEPHTAPDRPRSVADTSQDTPLTLLTLQVSAPAINSPHLPPQQWKWWNLDTSRGTPKTLYADSVKPFFNPPQPVLDWQRPVADTSHGTPIALLPVAAPFVNPPTLQVDCRRDVHSDIPVNLVIQTPGTQPFAQYNWPNAIEYRLLAEPKWDFPLSPAFIPDAVVDTPPFGGVGEEYGKKKKRFVRKIGNRLVSFSNAADALNFDARPDEVELEAVVEVKTIKAKAKTLERPEVAVLLKQKDYTAVLEAYEAMLDEEDIEMLLLSL